MEWQQTRLLAPRVQIRLSEVVAMRSAITRRVLGSWALGTIACGCFAPTIVDPDVLATTPSVFAQFANPPVGIAVSPGGRTFVSFSRALDEQAPYSLGELVAGTPVLYPPGFQQDLGDPADDRLLSVQAITFDGLGRLWILDSGKVGQQPIRPGTPKLVAIDLRTNEVVRRLVLPPEIAGPTAMISDVRIDLTHGSAGTAFLTDASSEGPNGLIVIDLGRGTMMRRLGDHPSMRPEPNLVTSCEGQPLIIRQGSKAGTPFRAGVDGVALDADGHHLYYRPLTSRHLYRVNTDGLVDPNWTDLEIAGTIEDLGDLGFASDGLLEDTAGRLFLTDYEHNSIWRLDDGRLELIAQSSTLLWPDTMSLGPDGKLVCTASQLERSPRLRGTDETFRPFTVWQIATDSQPLYLGGEEPEPRGLGR